MIGKMIGWARRLAPSARLTSFTATAHGLTDCLTKIIDRRRAKETEGSARGTCCAKNEFSLRFGCEFEPVNLSLNLQRSSLNL
jgi:hypothetical protein